MGITIGTSPLPDFDRTHISLVLPTINVPSVGSRTLSVVGATGHPITVCYLMPVVYVSVYTGSFGVIGVASPGSLALSGTGAPVSGGVSATGVPGKCVM